MRIGLSNETETCILSNDPTPSRLDQKATRRTLSHAPLLRLTQLALTALSIGALGCASSIGGDMDQNSGADGGTTPSATADAGEQNQDDAAPPTGDAGIQQATLQAGSENTVTPGNSVSCNSGGPDFFHADNHYYRTYPLPTVGISSDFQVSSVDIGVEEAASLGGTQPVQVSLHTLTGELLLANLTLLASTSVAVPDQTASILNVPIEASVPAGSTLVVEVFTPSGQETSNRFFIGSNPASEAFPSFIRAPGGNCVIDEPTATSDLGVPGLIMSIVLNVTGTHSS